MIRRFLLDMVHARTPVYLFRLPFTLRHLHADLPPRRTVSPVCRLRCTVPFFGWFLFAARRMAPPPYLRILPFDAYTFALPSLDLGCWRDYTPHHGFTLHYLRTYDYAPAALGHMRCRTTAYLTHPLLFDKHARTFATPHPHPTAPICPTPDGWAFAHPSGTLPTLPHLPALHPFKNIAVAQAAVNVVQWQATLLVTPQAIQTWVGHVFCVVGM